MLSCHPRFRHFFFGVVGALALSAPAFSLGLVRPISTAEAQNGVCVAVAEAGGVNIDFSPTGEIVRRAWIDDPSRVTLDFDGDISSDGAYIIHLRRVLGVNFENLPRTSTTLLSVVTVDPATDERNVYLFRLSYPAGEPSYSTLRIEEPPASGGVVLATGRSVDLNFVATGLQMAIAQRVIAEDSPVVGRVNTFLSLARNGSSLPQAATEAGVSMPLVTRLAELGADPGNQQSQVEIQPAESTAQEASKYE